MTLQRIAALLAACTSLCPHAASADAPEEAWGWHGQSTYIWQAKPAFRSPYEGEHSLLGQREKSYSYTGTLALGARPWTGGELYLDAELVQGVSLSELSGLGGLSNGELQKTSGSNPVLYRARAYWRQSWDLGGPDDVREAVEPAMNQLGGTQARRRVVLTLGELAITDLFDNNRYAHDARNQFLNWALLTHGHYDFAADARGYTRGAALEWFDEGWALRGGRFMVPVESNGEQLDTHLRSHYGDQVELEHSHTLAGRPGTLRLLAFRNVARMASFDDALAAAGAGVPVLDGVRRRQAKVGWGLALEQELGATLGGFARLGRHDGRTEPYSYAAIDDAVSAGLVWRGAAWSRSEDELGLALASNGLSASHRRFLAAGGSDFFLGDGRLNYGREDIAEAYYAAALARGLKLSLDLQHIAHPGYNRDRGPVNLLALRLHAEL
jgi:hypothetical protein